MNDIDKYFAEQCGVEVLPYSEHEVNGKRWLYKWTIQDPRCREIVRERFRILTHPFMEKDYVVTQCRISDTNKILREGKTIAEAEIACITKIWEARDD